MKEHTCPTQTWFKFKGGCSITTCKAYCDKPESKCVYIETGVTLTSDISDVRLSEFKIINHSEFVTVKKKAILKVRSLLTLYRFVGYIKEKNFNVKHVNFSNQVLSYLDKYPFNIPVLGFENWMLPILLDVDEYNKFLLSIGECADKCKIKLHHIFNLSPKDFNNLQTIVNKKTLF